MTGIRVLIVDDEVKLVRSISFALGQAGFECLLSYSGAQALAVVEKECPDLVLLDVKMPGASGLDVLKEIKALRPRLPIIMMSALDATQDAVRAVKSGAFDYLSKPFDMDDLIQLIGEAVAVAPPAPREQPLENQSLDEVLLLGSSPVIDRLRERLERIVSSASNCVLILGEVGVGKSVIARELHRRTRGVDAPLVELNCSTLAADKAEAELFGRGPQYDGGLARRGLLDIADGGTLFLHEVESLPIAVQTRLMVFFEWGSLRPRADGGPTLDVQVIVSTHTDLSQALANNTLRHDLYLKLTALPLTVPPLRERGKDIDLLALRFVYDAARRTGERQITLSEGSLERFRAYDWPGNVRELKNLIERLTVLSPGALIDEAKLPDELHGVKPQDQSIEEQMRHIERDLVVDALARARGRKGLAAEKLGISRHALKRRMQKLGLQ